MRAKCLDPKWKYRRACETNIKLTFDRERKRLAEEAAKDRAKVRQIKQVQK